MDQWFPRAEFGEIYVPQCEQINIKFPKKGIRLRIVLGGLGASYLAELANSGTEWGEMNPDHILKIDETIEITRRYAPRLGDRLESVLERLPLRETA